MGKSRKQVYKEIEEAAGFVPTFFQQLSDARLEDEWNLFAKTLDEDANAIPLRYRELIGVAVAAQMQCEYCIHAHSEFARIFGASDEEIEDAVSMAKHTAGWSTYIAGLETDIDEFKGEIAKVCDHMRKNL